MPVMIVWVFINMLNNSLFTDTCINSPFRTYIVQILTGNVVYFEVNVSAIAQLPYYLIKSTFRDKQFEYTKFA